MKRDRIKTLLLAEALICALLALALWLFEGDAFSVAGFPGSAVGQGLSALAASGRFGFALAFTLYAAVILLPLYALVHIGARRELKPEDALLVFIAFAAACALFPRGWTTYWSTSAEALFPRLAWQWLIFALLAGWVVLRLLRRFSGGDTQELLKLFRALLILAAAYFVFEVCFAEFAGLFSTIDALKAGNTAFTDDTVLPVATDITGSKSLVFSYVVLALRFAAEVLPTLLAAATAYFAVGLLLRARACRMVRQGPQDQRAVRARGQHFAGGLRAAHPQHQHFHPPAGPRAVLRAGGAPRCAAHRLERRPCGGQRPLYLRMLPWRSRYIWTRC